MARNGLTRLIKDLDIYADEVTDEVKRGVSETAALINTEASSAATVDEGNLKNSITSYSNISGLSSTVEVGANYAPWVEWGTGIHAEGPGGSRAEKIPWTYKGADGKFYTTYGMVAQPFWFPAIDQGEKYFKAYFD